MPARSLVLVDECVFASTPIESVFERHQNVIEMLANGMKRLGDRGAIELFDHVKKQR